MDQSRWIAAVAAGESIGDRKLRQAHMIYRAGSGPHLFRARDSAPPRGGLMGIDSVGFHGSGDPAGFCSEVLRECAARRFSGVICRFGGHPVPVLGEVVQLLGERCRERKLSCFVTEQYGDQTRANVMIPTALSGGSLRVRLAEAVGRFGADRVTLWLDRVAEDFILPSPTGSGTALSPEELKRLKEEKCRAGFFSDELCAHYFTYMSGEQGHFVLFDDVGSLRKKLHIAEQLGIGRVILPVGELGELLPRLLEQ